MSAALSTNVDARALRTTKFPAEFSTKVDMKKVNVPVIKIWISDQIKNILNNDDDVVPELVFQALEDRYPNIKALQIGISGFLDKDAPKFCARLWSLLISAQTSPQGVPKELLEAKKQELERERMEEDQARNVASRRQEAERAHDRDIDDLRRRDRTVRHKKRSRSRSPRRRSPSPRRHSPLPPPRPRYEDRLPHYNPHRTTARDTYVPGDGNHRSDKRQRRSPSYIDRRSRSRSRQRRRSSSRSPSPARKRRYSSDDDSRAARDSRRAANKSDRYRSRRDRSSSRSYDSMSRSPSPKRSRRQHSNGRRRDRDSRSRSRERVERPRKAGRRRNTSSVRSPTPRSVSPASHKKRDLSAGDLMAGPKPGGRRSMAGRLSQDRD